MNFQLLTLQTFNYTGNAENRRKHKTIVKLLRIYVLLHVGKRDKGMNCFYRIQNHIRIFALCE